MEKLSGLPKVTQLESDGQGWVLHQFCLIPVLILYRLLPNLLHPRFLRHSWDGAEKEPIATPGK